MNEDKIIFSSYGGWIYLIFQVEHRFMLKLSASYLDDIPLIWLNSILANLKDKVPFILKGDSEGSKFSIMESDEGLMIVMEDTGGFDLDYFGTLFLPRISKKELVEEILLGIKNYFSEMINWNPGNLSEEDRIKRKNLLISKFKEVRIYLDKEGIKNDEW